MSINSELKGIIRELKPYVNKVVNGDSPRIKIELIKLFIIEYRTIDKFHKIIIKSPTYTHRESIKKLNAIIKDNEVIMLYELFCGMRGYISKIHELHTTNRRVHMAAIELLKINNEIINQIHKIVKATKSTTVTK